MPNYWLGIMAAAFAIAMTVWISLVFWAGRKSPGRPQVPLPPREIVGGAFEARQGGRQLMPDPLESIVHDETGEGLPARPPGPTPAAPVADTGVPEQRKGPVLGKVVPEQRKGSVPEQEPVTRDHPPARR
jgi:hypothetical protein